MNGQVPQLDGGLFLTDAGLETSLIFLDGVELPHFAAFTLLRDAEGRERLKKYFRHFLELAAETPGAGFILDTATWRASADWGTLLGYDRAALARANVDAAALARELREEWQQRIDGPIVLSGVIGPRGDGYVADSPTSIADAAAYHRPQAEALKQGGADMLTAVTMTNSDEAIGIVKTANEVGLPVVISFTVETDGRLPTGQALRDAIERVDAQARPAYFAVNCAHPTHFESCFADGGEWTSRIRGIRANASKQSHAELDAATELDAGDPVDLGSRYIDLRGRLPALNVLGGCCGTDHRHLRAIRDAWVGGVVQ